MTMTAQSIDTSTAAAMCKAALRAAYPHVKFSVRKDRGTACAWLRVTYTDGPTERAVQEVADRYAGSRFNAQSDVYDELPDRLVQFDGEALPRTVRFLVDGVLVSREIGPAGRTAVAERIAAVAPGVHVLDPGDTFSDAVLTPDQAATLAGANYAHGTTRVHDVARPVFTALDLSA